MFIETDAAAFYTYRGFDRMNDALRLNDLEGGPPLRFVNGRLEPVGAGNAAGTVNQQQASGLQRQNNQFAGIPPRVYNPAPVTARSAATAVGACVATTVLGLGAYALLVKLGS